MNDTTGPTSRPPLPDPADRPPRRRGRRQRIHRRRLESRAVAVASALVAMAFPAHPTSSALANSLWSAAFVVLVSVAASKSRRSAWIWLTGLTAIGAAGSDWIWGAAVALGLSVWAAFDDHRSRPFGALIGAFAGLALLHQPELGFHGAPTLFAAVAVAPVLASAFERCDKKERRILMIATAAGLVLVVVLSTGAVLAGLSARSKAKEAEGFARTAISATHNGDQAGASAAFAQAADAFAASRAELAVGWATPATWIPVVGPNIDALRGATGAGESVARAAQVVGISAPYESLRMVDGQVDLTHMAGMRRPVNDALHALHDAQATLADIDSSWLLAPVARPVREFIDEINGLAPQVEVAASGLDVLPAMMGADRPQHYLVEFTSPAETRFLGGFVGAYGVLTADRGRLTLTISGSSDSLNKRLGPQLQYVPPPDYLARYDRFRPEIYSQNWTASPDLPTDADVDRQLFEQATGTVIDGVIVADVYGLAALLQLTGPVSVPGFAGPLDSKGAIQYLLRDQYILYSDEIATQVDARRERLSDVARSTFDAVTTTNLPGLRVLADALGPAVAGDHLMFTTFAPGSTEFLGRLGVTGTFAPTPGSDFVSLRSANANPNKIDVYLQRSLTYEADVDPGTGEVTATAVITLTNTAPSSGLPDYVIGNNRGRPPGSNTTYVSLYTPLELVSATEDGADVGMEIQREFDNPVYSRTVTVPAGGTLELRIGLHGVVPAIGRSHIYALDLLAQPMVNPDRVRVAITSTRAGHRATSITGPTGTGTVEDGVAVSEGVIDRTGSFEVLFR